MTVTLSLTSDGQFLATTIGLSGNFTNHVIPPTMDGLGELLQLLARQARRGPARAQIEGALAKAQERRAIAQAAPKWYEENPLSVEPPEPPKPKPTPKAKLPTALSLEDLGL